jgi:hypothetical protein
MPANDNYAYGDYYYPPPTWRQQDWLPAAVPTPVAAPCGCPYCAPVTVTWTAAETGSYSIGGGTVAPVPQAVPVAAAATAQAKPAAVPSFATPREAADAALTYFLERRAEQPEHFTCLVKRQDGRVVTHDTLDACIRAAQKDRQIRVDLTALDVGMVGADTGGVTFLCEGIRKL